MPDLGAVWDEEVARFMPEEAKIAAERKEKRSSPGERTGASYRKGLVRATGTQTSKLKFGGDS